MKTEDESGSDLFKIELNYGGNIICNHMKHLYDEGKYCDLVLECSDYAFKIHKFIFSLVDPNLDLSNVERIKVDVYDHIDIQRFVDLLYYGQITPGTPEQLQSLKKLIINFGCWDKLLPHMKEIPKFLREENEFVKENILQFFYKEEEKDIKNIKHERQYDDDDGGDYDENAADDFLVPDDYLNVICDDDEEDLFSTEVKTETEQNDSSKDPDPDYEGGGLDKKRKTSKTPKKHQTPAKKKKKKKDEDATNGESATKKVLKKRGPKPKKDEGPPPLEFFLINGESVHRSKVGWGCHYCDVTWSNTRSDLRYDCVPKHIRKKHPEVDEEKIKEIVKTIPLKLPAENHPLLRVYKEKHSHENKFFCPNCEKNFPLFQTLKKHVLLDHNGENLAKLNTMDTEPYKCDKCAKSYSYPQHLREHMETIHAKIETQHACEICGSTFITKRRLEDHIKRVHEKSLAKKCRICNETLSNNSSLERHMNSHLGIRPFKCEHCDSAFFSSTQKSRHVKVVHFNERNYECTLCEKRFATKGKLKDHTDTIHLNIKRYACEYCDQRFSCAGNRKKHMDSSHRDRTK